MLLANIIASILGFLSTQDIQSYSRGTPNSVYFKEKMLVVHVSEGL